MEFIDKIQNLISGLSFGSDILFGILFFVFLIVWGLSLGKTRVIVSLIALYLAYVIIDLFPYWSQVEKILNTIPGYLVRLAVFGLVYILVFLILNGSFIKKRFAADDFNLIAVLIASFLQIMFMAAVCLSFLPAEIVQPYAKNFYPILAGELGRFIWISLPIPGLLILSALRR